MLYDVRLELQLRLRRPVHGGRHLIRVVPAISMPGVQRVIAASAVV
jgi:hypothetical protein